MRRGWMNWLKQFMQSKEGWGGMSKVISEKVMISKVEDKVKSDNKTDN